MVYWKRREPPDKSIRDMNLQEHNIMKITCFGSINYKEVLNLRWEDRKFGTLLLRSSAMVGKSLKLGWLPWEDRRR